MPPVAVATEAMAAPGRDVTPAGSPRRRGPAAVVIVLVTLIIAAAVVAVIVATQRNGGTSGNGVKHGKPRLDQPLERDVRRLENLVNK
jgi:hypothetical protein